jgi:hypothetical protein
LRTNTRAMMNRGLARTTGYELRRVPGSR